MKRGFLMTFALLLLAVGAYFVSGTYANYVERVQKEGTATIAKWDFSNDNPDGNLTINLAENYDPTTLSAGKIAPGTSGSFDIALSNEHTETAVEVTVGIVTDKAPKNLKFYSDDTYTTSFDDTELKAILEAKDATGLSKTIYWKWEYSTDATNDALDTEDGKAANTMTVTLTLTGTQVDPGTTVTKGWVTA